MKNIILFLTIVIFICIISKSADIYLNKDNYLKKHNIDNREYNLLSETYQNKANINLAKNTFPKLFKIETFKNKENNDIHSDISLEQKSQDMSNNNILENTQKSNNENDIDILDKNSLQDTRNLIIENLLNDYMDKNADCHSKLNNDIEFEKLFKLSYKKYINKKFSEKLNKIPDLDKIDKLNSLEFDIYKDSIKNLPNCDQLIKNYNISKLNDVNVIASETEEISDGQIRNLYIDEFRKIEKQLKDLSSKIVVPNNDINVNKDNINTKSYINQSENMNAMIKDDNIDYQESDINKDIIQQKNVDKKYLDANKHVNQQMRKLDQFNNNTMPEIPMPEIPMPENLDTSKYLVEKEKINKKILSNTNEKYYVDSENTKNSFFNDKSNWVSTDKTFNFKPKITFNHNEPSKTIASAYGWSYMPPQTWSVPQKRPPVCIPDTDKQATVKPIYDKGTPVDALDWLKSNEILPKVEYSEKYNENYYYPGWKAQENIEYPLSGSEKSGEYFNYNLSKKTSE